jgi:hypothetical protein
VSNDERPGAAVQAEDWPMFSLWVLKMRHQVVLTPVRPCDDGPAPLDDPPVSPPLPPRVSTFGLSG